MATPRKTGARKSPRATPVKGAKKSTAPSGARRPASASKSMPAGKSVKPKPVAAPKPAAASKPVVAPKPGVASKPVAASKPAAASRPVVVSKTGVVSKPGAAPKPGAAVSKPGAASKPVASAKTAPVKPGAPTVPDLKRGAVKGPVKPAVAGKPVLGGKPAVGGKPVPGKKGAPSRKGPVRSPAEVRPIGVLPPSAMARTPPRPAVAASSVHRPAPTRTVSTKPPAGDQRVTEKDFQEFEQRLMNERRRILKEMGHLENTVLKVNQRDSAGDLSGYSFHMADIGTDSMEREKAFLFASAEGRMLLEINEALRRLYRGEFGVCESCTQSISRARLEAMPYVRLCLPCKEKEERAQRGAL